MFEAGGRRGSMFGSSKAARLKNEAREDAKTRARGDARRGGSKARSAAAEAGDAFREELVTCAAEAILPPSARKTRRPSRAGARWRSKPPRRSAPPRCDATLPPRVREQTETEAATAPPPAAPRRTPRSGSSRACARRRRRRRARVRVPRPRARPGRRFACSRRWCRRADPRNTRAVRRTTPRWRASRGSRVGTSNSPRRRRRERRRRRARGPLGRAIAAIVRDLCAGGAGRAFAERRNAAAQREAGTLHAPEEDEDGPARGGASSSDAPSSDVCPTRARPRPTSPRRGSRAPRLCAPGAPRCPPPRRGCWTRSSARATGRRTRGASAEPRVSARGGRASG